MTQEKFFHEYSSPIGTIYISQKGDFLTGVSLTPADETEYMFFKTSLIEKTENMLTEYFEGKRRTFDLPLAKRHTVFQQKVLEALRSVPYGETKSYKEIAIMAGSPNASRAVGQANRTNPFIIIVPCHRIINADGSLGGFACGLEVKKYLLHLENPSLNL